MKKLLKQLAAVKKTFLLFIIMSLTNSINAQSTTWSLSANASGYATINANTGVVTMTTIPQGVITATATATKMQNGKIITGTKQIEIIGCITVGSLCWATSNITYDPSTYDSSCDCYRGLKMADSSYDKGLLFQWGGTMGIGYSNSGSWNDSPKYISSGSVFPSYWPCATCANRYPNYNTAGYNTPLISFDPCSKIDGGWRMPSINDYTSSIIWSGWNYSSSFGGYFYHNSGVIFPNTYSRSYLNGSLDTNYVFYSTSSQSAFGGNNTLQNPCGAFLKIGLSSMYLDEPNKSTAGPVRCIKI